MPGDQCYGKFAKEGSNSDLLGRTQHPWIQIAEIHCCGFVVLHRGLREGRQLGGRAVAPVQNEPIRNRGPKMHLGVSNFGVHVKHYFRRVPCL